MAEAATRDVEALHIDGAATGRRHLAPSTGSRAANIRPRDETGRLSPEEHHEMGSRGTLEVSDKAVERIAEAATLEVPGVAPAATTTNSLGNVLGRAYPRVDVHVAGRRARARVEVVTHWPRPAAHVASAVRQNVGDRLRLLADLDVDAVQVDVARVIRPTAPERRRVQ